MPLRSKLFTEPRDWRLEACLIDDAKHIAPGATGDHVKRIQIALNSLTHGPGRENIFLVMDGIYGPKTAAAVKRYKDAPRRHILQSWQTSADNIVGKRTLQSLDDEMGIFEEETIGTSEFIAFDYLGPPHDHSRCPPSWMDAEIEIEVAPQGTPTAGTMSHLATPINPLGHRRMINIGGVFEAVRFIDYVPDPRLDPSMRRYPIKHRFFTSEIPKHQVSDICFRSAPIDTFMQGEILRICMVGARLTFVGDIGAAHDGSLLDYFLKIGVIMEMGKVPDKDTLVGFRNYVIVSVLYVNPDDKDPF
jgi:hypothetical protein